MALFVPYLERRLGVVADADPPDRLRARRARRPGPTVGDGFTLMAGGNGIALGAVGAWWALHRADAREDPTEEYDWIAVAVAAGILLLLPLVEDLANPWAGAVGGLVGLGCGSRPRSGAARTLPRAR